jgi:iron complex transport system substrate-binding protein
MSRDPTFPRIVSLQPSISVTLAALGRVEHLSAVPRWCVEQVPELAGRGLAGRGLAVLPDSWSAKAEDLAGLHALKPDMVAASVPYQLPALAAILESGLPVLAFAPHSLADVERDTRFLGLLTGAKDEAEGLIAALGAAILRVQEKVSGLEPRRVYCEEWGKPLIYSQPWVNELVAAAGGIAVGTAGGHTTAEEIAAADPEVMVLAWCGAGDRVPLERVVAQRGWQKLRAVRERRVYCVPDEYLNTPAIPSLLDGLACIAAAVRPEVFAASARMRRLAGDCLISIAWVDERRAG